jgi:hypothetical protein
MLCFYTSECNVHAQFVLAFKLLLLCVFWKENVFDLEIGGEGVGREDIVNDASHP